MTEQWRQGRFWMVVGLNRSGPNFKHASYASAKEEAQRLARQHACETFVVLMAKEAFRVPETPVELVPMVSLVDEIPF